MASSASLNLTALHYPPPLYPLTFFIHGTLQPSRPEPTKATAAKAKAVCPVTGDPSYRSRGPRFTMASHRGLFERNSRAARGEAVA